MRTCAPHFVRQPSSDTIINGAATSDLQPRGDKKFELCSPDCKESCKADAVACEVAHEKPWLECAHKQMLCDGRCDGHCVDAFIACRTESAANCRTCCNHFGNICYPQGSQDVSDVEGEQCLSEKIWCYGACPYTSGPQTEAQNLPSASLQRRSMNFQAVDSLDGTLLEAPKAEQSYAYTTIDDMAICLEGTNDDAECDSKVQDSHDVEYTCMNICQAKKDACDILHSESTFLGYASDCARQFTACRHSCSHYTQDKTQAVAQEDDVACLHTCQAKENTCNSLWPPKKNCAQQAWACRHSCTSREAAPKDLVAREDQAQCLHLCQAKKNTCSTMHPSGKHCDQQHWACRQNCNQRTKEPKALAIREDQAACFHKCESAKNTCNTILPTKARPNCELKRARCRKACTPPTSEMVKREVNKKSADDHADIPKCVSECATVFADCEDNFGAGTRMCRDNRGVCERNCKLRKQVAVNVVSTFVTQVSKRAGGTLVNISPVATLPANKLGCATECKVAEVDCLYTNRDEWRCSSARTACDTRCLHSNSVVSNTDSDSPAKLLPARSLANPGGDGGQTTEEMSLEREKCFKDCNSDALCILKCVSAYKRTEATSTTIPILGDPINVAAEPGKQICFAKCNTEEQKCMFYGGNVGVLYCAQIRDHCMKICDNFPWPWSKRDMPISTTTVFSSTGTEPAVLPLPNATGTYTKLEACLSNCHAQQERCNAVADANWQSCYREEGYCIDLCLAQTSPPVERDVSTNTTATFPDDVLHVMSYGPEITPPPVSAFSAQSVGSGPWHWVPFLFCTEEK